METVVEIRGATDDDFDAVVEVLAARSRAALGVSDVVPEVVRWQWDTPSFEVGRDNWVAVDGDEMVGYGALHSTQDADLAAPDPETGDALLARVEARARERGFGWIAVTAVPEDEPLLTLLERAGFALDRETWRMWKPLEGDLPEPRWPGGVAVRTYEDADALRVHALLDEAYAGWDDTYVTRSHDDWLSVMTAHEEFDPELWFLVEREGELVAAALHWKESSTGEGWVKDLVVRESERGNGLGRALLAHAFLAYAGRGATRVGLKVDSTNPTGAPKLYERVGMVTDRRYGIWRKAL